MRRVYEVEVVHRVFVTALNEDSAARWVENNVTEWSSEMAESVVASAVLPGLSDEVKHLLPWAADGLDDDECNLTVLQWVEREAKARTAK